MRLASASYPAPPLRLKADTRSIHLAPLPCPPSGWNYAVGAFQDSDAPFRENLLLEVISLGHPKHEGPAARPGPFVF